MPSLEILYKAVKGMLIDSVDVLIYPATSIQQGFQAPTSGNFITFLRLPSSKTGITGVNQYQNNEDDTIHTVTNLQLYSNLIQVDFYSDATKDAANMYYASDEAEKFNQYLTAFAMAYLFENYPDISIGVIEEVVNTTNILDKPKYVNRYTQRFTMFTHNEITKQQQFISEIDVKNEFIN